MAAVLALLLVCLPMGLPPVYSSPVEDRCGWGPGPMIQDDVRQT